MAAGTGVEVTISLAPELADRLVPGAVVFVYARATQGPRAPLAVVRRPVDALPLTIRLDDSQAMSPELKLSAFAEVVVGARISQSGAAAPRSGDLQGQSTPLRPSPDAKAAVVIDQAVP